MKVDITFSQARSMIESIIEGLPQQGATVLRKPRAMFDAETLEPNDLVAMLLVRAGFDANVMREDSPEGAEARKGNTKHLFLTGYRYFFHQNDDVFGGPNFAVKVFLGDLTLRTDRGIPAGKAYEQAVRHTWRVYDRSGGSWKAETWNINA